MALVHPERSPLLARLFENHAKKLVGFVARTLGRADIAEDVAQNAFLRLQQVKNLEQLDNPQAYLYTTARNLVIDDSRRASHRTHYEVSLSHEQAQIGDCEEPEKHLLAQRELAVIEAALAKLPAPCQRAFLLHRLDGKRHQDIADIMGVSVSSVEKYIRRAFQACQLAQQKFQTSADKIVKNPSKRRSCAHHQASTPKVRDASKPPPSD